MQDNRYQPPRAEIDITTAARKAEQRRARLPVGLLARWVISVALIVFGGLRLYRLAGSWSWFADRATIDERYSPYPWLAFELCMVAAGFLLLRRSTWVFAPIVFHAIVFTWQALRGTASAPFSGEVYAVWTAELAMFSFCAWLFLQGRLR